MHGEYTFLIEDNNKGCLLQCDSEGQRCSGRRGMVVDALSF